MEMFDNLFGKKNTINLKIGDREVSIDSVINAKIGHEKYELRDYKEAIKAFTEAIKTNDRNQNFYIYRGTVYEDMGNDVEAEKDFKKAIDIRADFLSMYRYGMVQYRKKDLNEAITWLKKSYDTFPNFITEEMGLGSNNIRYVGKQIICANLGSFLLQLNQFDESIKYSKEATTIAPKYHIPHFNIGVALFQKDKTDDAIPYIRKAAELGFPKAILALQEIMGIED